MPTAPTQTPIPGALSASAMGDTLVVAGIAGLRVSLLRYTLKVAGAVTATWKSSGGTALSGPMTFAAAGDGVIEPDTEDGYVKTLPGEGLTLNLSASVAVGGYLNYQYE